MHAYKLKHKFKDKSIKPDFYHLGVFLAGEITCLASGHPFHFHYSSEDPEIVITFQT